jgi:hypothetical protein
VRLYNQMPEPKYVVAMGACASGRRPVQRRLQRGFGVDKYVPVDVYIPGCPPTPQALLHGLITLQKKIDTQSSKRRALVQQRPVGAIPVPVLGPDDGPTPVRKDQRIHDPNRSNSRSREQPPERKQTSERMLKSMTHDEQTLVLEN